MASSLIDVTKLADLLGQLSQRLVSLSTDITAWLAAQSAMDKSLSEANAIAVQINGLGFGLNIPLFTEPVNVDPAWVQSILDSAAKMQQSTEVLKDVTPAS